MQRNKIIHQMIPANGDWRAFFEYQTEEGYPAVVDYPVAAWALVDTGEVLPMIAKDGGGLEPVRFEVQLVETKKQNELADDMCAARRWRIERAAQGSES